MRFTFAESMCDPQQYTTLAVEAEQAGYSSFSVPESIMYPKESDSKYPYTPDGNREFLENKPFIDPFVLMGALGAVTERLRFTTFVVKLPMRHPVHAAKQAISVAVMTNNRLGFGVGLSPWPDDFRVLDVPWKGRGKRLDEMIEILRGLETGEFFEYHGEHFDLEPIKLCPAPSQPIPILVGGHSELALRRAARLGDGWMHAGGGEATDFDAAISRINDLRAEYGRDQEPFEVHVISMDAYTADGVKRLEDKGVTDCIVGFRNAYEEDTMPLQQKIDALKGFADAVISKVA
ncbi:MAG: LLM class F420-dependent oxidoreductase [Deltaproteobacteria bacterium]|nr:LLM class F420-dependent oxidoreductase [Deltaproteobacteria bacterium]